MCCFIGYYDRFSNKNDGNETNENGANDERVRMSFDQTRSTYIRSKWNGYLRGEGDLLADCPLWTPSCQGRQPLLGFVGDLERPCGVKLRYSLKISTFQLEGNPRKCS